MREKSFELPRRLISEDMFTLLSNTKTCVGEVKGGGEEEEEEEQEEDVPSILF